MKIGSRYFEDAGFCGVFDNDFGLVWNDNPPIFRKMMQYRDKFSVFADDEQLTDIPSFVFRFDGRFFCAVFSIVKQEFIMCRVYPEVEKKESASSISNELENISCGALNVINSINSIVRSVDNKDFDNLPLYLKEQQQDAEVIYSECFNLSNRFIGRTAAVFVPLRSCVIRTFARIEKMTSKLCGKILCCIDIEYEYAKIDYNNFQKALYNIAKLFFKCSEENAVIKIISHDENEITLDCRFRAYKNFETFSCDTEIRCIKSIFSLLKGNAEIVYSEKNVEINASVPVTLTSSRIKAERFNLNAEKRGIDLNDNFVYLGGNSNVHYMNSDKISLTVDESEDYGSVILGSLIGDFM